MLRRMPGLVVVIGLSALTLSAVTPAGAIPAASAPGSPGQPTAVSGNKSARISWPAPTNGGAPISIYLVTPFLGTRALTPRAFHSNKTSEVITGLVNGKSYTFTVAAHNALGTGTPSDASRSVTIGVPSAPSGLTVAPGSEQATVSWRAPANHGHAVVSYVITPYLGTVAQTSHTFHSTATSEIVTGLTDLKSYAFRVAARNRVGTGPQSAPAGPVRPTSAPTLSLATITNSSGPHTVTQTNIVDAYGHPLYLYAPDGAGPISKAGSNLGLWPAVVWSGTPTVAGGLDASKAAVFVQRDGARQLSYNGHLLYTFLYDFTPGTATGDGETSFYLLDGAGNQN
jgi:predicted lipoprotein with Yx(FWY)xxD motif